MTNSTVISESTKLPDSGPVGGPISAETLLLLDFYHMGAHYVDTLRFSAAYEYLMDRAPELFEKVSYKRTGEYDYAISFVALSSDGIDVVKRLYNGLTDVHFYAVLPYLTKGDSLKLQDEFGNTAYFRVVRVYGSKIKLLGQANTVYLVDFAEGIPNLRVDLTVKPLKKRLKSVKKSAILRQVKGLSNLERISIWNALKNLAIFGDRK